MADKLNMSLDDIIRLKKKNEVKKENGGGNREGNRKQFPIKKGAGARKIIFGGRGRIQVQQQQRKSTGGPVRKVAAQKQATVNQATKKLVQKLVKNAIRKRTAVVAQASPAVRRRGVVAATTKAIQRVRVVPQTKIIRQRIVAPPQQQRVIQQVRRVAPRNQRQIIRQVIQSPVQPQQRRVIRRPPPAQPARTVIVQRVGGNGGRRGGVFQSRPQQQQQTIRRRVQPQNNQRVVQIQRKPVRQQQFERVVEVVRRPQQNRRQNFRNEGNNQRTVVRQVKAYQPVQYVTERVVSRRGRGFNNNF